MQTKMINRLLGGDLSSMIEDVGAGCFTLYLMLRVHTDESTMSAAIGDSMSVGYAFGGLSRNELQAMLVSLESKGWVSGFTKSNDGYLVSMGEVVDLQSMGALIRTKVYTFDATVANLEKTRLDMAMVESKRSRPRSPRANSSRRSKSEGAIQAAMNRDAAGIKKSQERASKRAGRNIPTKSVSRKPLPYDNKMEILRSYSKLYEEVVGVKCLDLIGNNYKPNARGSKLLTMVGDFGLEGTWRLISYFLDNWEDLEKTSKFHNKLPTPDVIKYNSEMFNAWLQQGLDPVTRLRHPQQRDRATVDEWDSNFKEEGGAW